MPLKPDYVDSYVANWLFFSLSALRPHCRSLSIARGSVFVEKETQKARTTLMVTDTTPQEGTRTSSWNPFMTNSDSANVQL